MSIRVLMSVEPSIGVMGVLALSNNEHSQDKEQNLQSQADETPLPDGRSVLDDLEIGLFLSRVVELLEQVGR